VLKVAEENIQKNGRSIFKMAIDIAEGHHERWDGTGYPNGWMGEEIPLSARIVAVADVFDALTSRRPYKEPFSYEDSIRIIIDGRSKHFDPDIIDSFVKYNNKIKELYNSFKTNS
jgi:HD-GYP domain-containing protein (c-di-GMP phosphodiesterase class II)